MPLEVSFLHWRFTALITCPSAPAHRFPCSVLHFCCRSGQECFSVLRPPGSPLVRIPPKRFAARIAARATVLLFRVKLYWLCRRRCPLFWSQAQGCSRAA